MQSALRLLYPSRCLSCGGLVDSDFGLCATCWRDTAFISGLVCDKCGVPLQGDDPGEEVLCDDCMNTERPWRHGRAAMLYRGNGRKLVLALKHGDRQDLAMPAGGWLARVAQPVLQENTLIAPVPLHWMRLLKRKYNQSALLARELAREVGCAYCPDLLQRTKRTRSLAGVGREARFAMLANSIGIHPRRRHRISGRPVVLVDDVMTSGATFAAAAAACLHAGASEVSVLALARAAKDD